jgi:CheY-like chemotaxis protein
MSTRSKIPPAVVLLAEDDPGDQLLTREAFESLHIPHDLRIVSDGMEALDYLYRRGSYTSPDAAPRPDLILLDLNMPRVGGQKVAEQIQADPALRDIPIVVLTTSRRHEDLLRAYGRGAATFITKPLDFVQFMDAVREVARLVRHALALKRARQNPSLSGRQVFRLLRRQQELEQITDAVFDRRIQQVEQALWEDRPQEAGENGDAARREHIVRVAQKILESMPARRLAREQQIESGPANPGMPALARSLESSSCQPGRRSRPASRKPDNAP